jgi:hypothetical protein
MACSDRKKFEDRPTRGDKITARLCDMYDGPMWQTLRAHYPDRGDYSPDIFVLSAKYGFVPAYSRGRPYNERISAQKVDELIRHGLHGQPRHRTKGHVLRGTLAGELDNGVDYHRVIIAGAGEYRRFFLWLVEAAKAEGIIPATAEVLICDGKGIGYQRQQLARFLALPAPVAEPEAPGEVADQLAAIADQLEILGERPERVAAVRAMVEFRGYELRTNPQAELERMWRDVEARQRRRELDAAGVPPIGHNGGPELEAPAKPVQLALPLEGGSYGPRRKLAWYRHRREDAPRFHWKLIPGSIDGTVPAAEFSIPERYRYHAPHRDHAAERAIRRMNEARRAA